MSKKSKNTPTKEADDAAQIAELQRKLQLAEQKIGEQSKTISALKPAPDGVISTPANVANVANCWQNMTLSSVPLPAQTEPGATARALDLEDLEEKPEVTAAESLQAVKYTLGKTKTNAYVIPPRIGAGTSDFIKLLKGSLPVTESSTTLAMTRRS